MKSSHPSRRKAERAQVRRRFHGIYFKAPEVGLKDVPVANISETGLGLPASKGLEALNIGQEFAGRLRVGTTVASVRVKLVHGSSNPNETYGFSFLEIPDLLKEAIGVYFEPELVGAKMKQRDSIEGVFRFQDGDWNMVQVESKDGKTVAAVSFEVMGNRVQWHTETEWTLNQNGKSFPLEEKLRKKLIHMIRNLQDMDESLRLKVENLLRGMSKS